MRYLSIPLTNFDEICMAMHISRSDPIDDQKLGNLKKFVNPRLWTVAILKMKKT